MSKSGGETAKLATLTKAIDSIQENSKSLETMGRITVLVYSIDTSLTNYDFYSEENEDGVCDSEGPGEAES